MSNSAARLAIFARMRWPDLRNPVNSDILAKFWKSVFNKRKPTKAITQPSHNGP